MVLLLTRPFLRVFASNFNDENHYLVLMDIASLTPLLS